MKNEEYKDSQIESPRPVGNPYPYELAGIVNEWADPENFADQEKSELRKANRISDSGTSDDDDDGLQTELEDDYDGA